MRWRTIASISIILLAFAFKGYSQDRQEVQGFSNLFKPAKNRPDYSLKIDPTNEFKLLLTSGFAFYKTFVSSQDGVK
jgi:hypothetical protein